MENDLIPLVKYKIEKASNTLSEARAYAEDMPLGSTVLESYYAMFYAVQALLQARRISSSGHAEVRDLFIKEFIDTGLMNAELSAFYSAMLERYQEVERVHFIEFQRESVMQWLDQADRFVTTVEQAAQKIAGLI
jgi:uncharacterized protein (UPF0332 family)